MTFFALLRLSDVRLAISVVAPPGGTAKHSIALRSDKWADPAPTPTPQGVSNAENLLASGDRAGEH